MEHSINSNKYEDKETGLIKKICITANVTLENNDRKII